MTASPLCLVTLDGAKWGARKVEIPGERREVPRWAFLTAHVAGNGASPEPRRSRIGSVRIPVDPTRRLETAMSNRDFRIEKNSLGEVSVPAQAYYGVQTQRAVDNFAITRLRPWRAFIWSIGLVKRAAAEVNYDLGLFKDREVDDHKFTAKQLADAIAQAAQEVMDRKWDTEFVVDPFQAGAGTSHNMNANEVIANRATQLLGGELGKYYVHPNDHVNMAQSTNDVIPTAIRLGALWRLDELLSSLRGLQSALELKAQEFDDIVKSGRTHLQDAVPVRLGQEFGAYATGHRPRCGADPAFGGRA